MIEALRAWARTHTIKKRYTPVGVAFHWVVAALVVFQLWWGWRTARMPVGEGKVLAYEVHLWVGAAILGLTVLRIIWRSIIPGPINDADAVGWRNVAGRLTHATFYVSLVFLPLSGMALYWSQPPLWWADYVHQAFALALTILIPVHVAAALQHHFQHRHDVLVAMVPGLEQLERAPVERPTAKRKPKGRRSRPATAAR